MGVIIIILAHHATHHTSHQASLHYITTVLTPAALTLHTHTYIWYNLKDCFGLYSHSMCNNIQLNLLFFLIKILCNRITLRFVWARSTCIIHCMWWPCLQVIRREFISMLLFNATMYAHSDDYNDDEAMKS